MFIPPEVDPFAPPSVDPQIAKLQARIAELEKALLWSERTWKIFVVVGVTTAMILGYHLGQMAP